MHADSARSRARLIQPANGPSLQEINGTVRTPDAHAGFWRTLAAYSGPGALVAVGYMDPGNWVTSIGGGSQFGYLLLSVILVSSLTAMLLQYMAAKLGIVTGMDLAQATRAHTGRRTGFVLWIITELAIMATDIAEVIGAAIALHLLFGMPLVVGVILTVLDVFLLLLLLHIGFRKIEAIVVTLIATIMVVFVYEVIIAQPDLPAVFQGFVPQAQILEPAQLTLALGIVGATVMPHNLYLHSAIVQSRDYAREDDAEKRRAVRFATWDSNIQLSAAFVINCLLLLLGAALFFGVDSDLGTFSSLYNALQDSSLAGAVASPVLSTLFAVALLASGQNSTITGTLTGQVVMEGFIRMRMPLWARRVITRGLAVIPVIACTLIYGGSEQALDSLLVNSQVFLCIALPVSMVPLVWFTSSKRIMGTQFANPRWVTMLGWLATAVLTVLNLKLVWETITALL
ncbi:Nramp family divalent metal transporter [Pseudoclavibacter soli]|uniref:Nramp family divalent metal transporter n=1 Tax=Pseudoclavibacter soli TaxID=452623 RepID=UPI000400B4A6|nr:Nramp family divalent metal transporter [Pseudoclavibacter soli]